MAVVDPDLDLVDAVCVGVGRGLEIRGRVEAQHAGVGVDAEQRRIAAAGQAEGGRVARIHVRGRDGGHPGLVLRRVQRRRRPPAVGVDHRYIVDVGHVDRKVLGRRERAVEDRQHHVVRAHRGVARGAREGGGAVAVVAQAQPGRQGRGRDAQARPAVRVGWW